MANVSAKTRRITLVILAALLLTAAAAVATSTLMVAEPAEARQDAPLSIDTAAISNTVLVGDPVNLTITETNNSHHTYHEVAVRNWLPDGVTYVSATPTQGEYWADATVTVNPRLMQRALASAGHKETKAGPFRDRQRRYTRGPDAAARPSIFVICS